MDEQAKETVERLPFFTYGTLMPGQVNAYLWGQSARALKTAVFPRGRLYDMGHYPMLVEGEGGPVRGVLVFVNVDVYEAMLACVDALEGFDADAPHASAYRRVARPVLAEDGRSLRAWVYLGHRRFVRGCPAITSGDWAAYARERERQLSAWWATVDTVRGLHEEGKEDE